MTLMILNIKTAVNYRNQIIIAQARYISCSQTKILLACQMIFYRKCSVARNIYINSSP